MDLSGGSRPISCGLGIGAEFADVPWKDDAHSNFTLDLPFEGISRHRRRRRRRRIWR
jgi:hypothetical protein